MWTMGRFFPFAVGHKVPKDNENWENFLRLLEIMDYVFARRIKVEDIGYLESLISDHHSTFRSLYPDVPITMKGHSMIHIPRLILQ